MSDFNVRSDSVDVEQIMRQIRARIREKRGVDYTEAEIQRAGQRQAREVSRSRAACAPIWSSSSARQRGVSPEPPNYEFEDTTLYETHRGAVAARCGKLLQPAAEAVLQPEPADPGAAHAGGDQQRNAEQRFREREELDAAATTR